MKKAWESAGSLRGDGGRYSIEAIKSVLRKKKKSFTDVYADFAAANVTPSRHYVEAPGVPEFANPKVLADVTLEPGRQEAHGARRAGPPVGGRDARAARRRPERQEVAAPRERCAAPAGPPAPPRA